MRKDLAIIVPTHDGHRFWLKPCLESCKKTGYPIYLAYDNAFWKHGDIGRVFPPTATMALADTIVMKHRTYARSVGFSHFWNMIYGLTTVKADGFKYVFNINGDCIMEKHQNFEKMVDMLGDNDLFPNQYIPEQRYCGTMGWIGKVDLMLKFFHTYREEAFMYSRTTEGRLWYFVQDNNLKVTIPENCEHNYRIPSPGTWYDILGFRHIHAEHKVRRRDKLKPVEKKHYDFETPNDIFLSKGEYAILNNYWNTGKQQYLEQWWG